jgi:hypothetical protein
VTRFHDIAFESGGGREELVLLFFGHAEIVQTSDGVPYEDVPVALTDVEPLMRRLPAAMDDALRLPAKAVKDTRAAIPPGAEKSL